MTFVAPLSHFGRDDLGLAGGKGANLGELVRAGLPVPDGFVVTTAGYDAAVGSLDLRVAERLAAGGGASIRADVEAITVPTEIRAEIVDAYAALGGGPVAVRSSATAEDLPGAAFAGQQDTYLNVIGERGVDRRRTPMLGIAVDRPGDRVPRPARHRLRRRSASRWSYSAWSTREVAGVMFTADPVSGDRDTIVIDASAGLGEAVVSGLVTPDHYLLDRDGRVRDYQPGRQEVVIRGAAGGGVDPRAWSATSRASGCPTRCSPSWPGWGRWWRGTSAGRRTSSGRTREDRIWLLQARPMTALPPPPLRAQRVPAAARIRSSWTTCRCVRTRIDMTTWVPYGPVGLMARVCRQVRHQQRVRDAAARGRVRGGGPPRSAHPAAAARRAAGALAHDPPGAPLRPRPLDRGPAVHRVPRPESEAWPTRTWRSMTWPQL